MSDSNSFIIRSAPFDSISKVRYSPTNPNHLLASSWDTTVRLYDTTNGANSEQKTKFDHRSAVLDCCFSDATHAYSGGLDHSIRHLELETESIRNVGAHTNAVSSIVWSKDANALISASWDRTLRFWDIRAENPQQSSYETPERIYATDLTDTKLVVAMASRLFHVYDIRRMDKPDQVRESSLKYMTRSLGCMSDKSGYAIGSVEGRIAVEYFDTSKEVQDKKYAFKCHRQTIDGVDHVWPVNALAFHPVHNTLASAGSDGTVTVWDHKLKKRLRQYPKFNNPVSSIAFNCNGTHLAIATSYTWDEGEQGIKGAESPMITVRQLGDEVKPKDRGD